MTKQKPRFMRTDFRKKSKLGVRRKKKQVYRKAKGRDNKIRLNMKGHVRKVKVGFKNNKKERDLINGLVVLRIKTLEDLKGIKEGQIVIVGKVGMKKKIEIANYAKENKIRLFNLNSERFLRESKEKMKQSKEKRQKTKEKQKSKEKKAKEKEKKVKEKEGLEEKTKTDDKKSEEKKEVKKPEKTKESKKQIQTNNYGRGK